MPDETDWGDAVVSPHDGPALERVFRRRTGVAPGLLPYICPHSWAYRPVLYLLNPNVQALDVDLCHQICFAVARDNACRYCYGSLQAVLRVAGYSAAELDRLEEELYLGDRPSSDYELLKFAVRISRGQLHHEDAIQSLLDAGYSLDAIREAAGNAVLVVITNRLATMLAVPIDEDLEDLTTPWYFDLLRPVVEPLFARWQRLAPFPDRPLRPEETAPPFAPWLAPLAGTGAGRVLQDVVAHWWDGESALPRRTKLFVLAVVAHGLSRRALTDRAGSLLAEHHGVPDDAFETAVEHLRGDALGRLEEALLPLARESIRYEAGPLQTAVREHTRPLSRAETIDGVATLGLSNALARLDALAPLTP
jgi:AhpD family alkylhydroperoxidase